MVMIMSLSSPRNRNDYDGASPEESRRYSKHLRNSKSPLQERNRHHSSSDSDVDEHYDEPKVRSKVQTNVSKPDSIKKENEKGSSKASSSDSDRSPDAKRRRSVSVEHDVPEWKKERSWTPEDQHKPRKWKERSPKSGQRDGKKSDESDEENKEKSSYEKSKERRRERSYEEDRERRKERYERDRERRQRDDYDRSKYSHRSNDYRNKNYSRDDRDRRGRYDRSERYDNRDRERDRVRENSRRDEKEDTVENKKLEQSSEEAKATKPVVEKKDKEATLATKTGGAYIPPAKLRMMQQAITDKNSAEYQRMSWEALKKSINGLVNKVNVANIKEIVRELFGENIVRGRGLLCRSLVQAQAASPTFTHVYAAITAIINSKFPQIGELLLKRLVLQFRRGYKRNDKSICLSASQFLAHLVNQNVAHEVIALEVLTLLLEQPTDDSVEIAVSFMKECGMKLTEVSPRGVNAIFERMRTVLHEANVTTRVQYMIEVMFQVRKDKFKDHVSVQKELELVDEDDQFTHLIALDDVTNGEDMLNIFKADPDFQNNEEKYKELKNEILGSDSEDGSDGGESGSDSSQSGEEDDEEKQNIIDQTETNLVGLRRTIYLTVQSSLDYEEAAHKLLKLQLKPGQEGELCNMILDCGAQQRTYEKFYGLLAQRFCMLDKKYTEKFEGMFMLQYETCHRLDPTKLRNVAKFFAHLLHTDAISWGVLQVVKMNEDDTTSSSRIFVKQMFLELAEYMGLPKLNERLKDETLQGYFEGLMPRDHPKKTRFAINFFTSIGLGGLTDGLREHLKNISRPAEKAAPPSSSSSSSDSSSSDSSSDSSSSDSSDSD